MVTIDLNSYKYKFQKVKYKRPTSGPALTIELIPRSCQGNSVYHRFPRKYWDKIRNIVFCDADYKCEICGSNIKINCHEVWEFKVKSKRQKLKYLMCICEACHVAKHFGRASLIGKTIEAAEHLCKINNWTKQECGRYIEEVFYKHTMQLAKVKFKPKLDLKLLEDFMKKYNVKMKRRSRCPKY